MRRYAITAGTSHYVHTLIVGTETGLMRIELDQIAADTIA